MPFESKKLLINKTGATGDAYLQLTSDRCSTKISLSLNFNNGKLKSSLNGQLQQQFFLQNVKCIERYEFEQGKGDAKKKRYGIKF